MADLDAIREALKNPEKRIATEQEDITLHPPDDLLKAARITQALDPSVKRPRKARFARYRSGLF